MVHPSVMPSSSPSEVVCSNYTNQGQCKKYDCDWDNQNKICSDPAVPAAADDPADRNSAPSLRPSNSPSLRPSSLPSRRPSSLPSDVPSVTPSFLPTDGPNDAQYCCSGDYKTCKSGAGDYCHSEWTCENRCDGLWIEQGSCTGIPLYGECTNDRNGCCPPASCKGNRWFRQCKP